MSSELSLEQPGLGSHLGSEPHRGPRQKTRTSVFVSLMAVGGRLLSVAHLPLQRRLRPLLNSRVETDSALGPGAPSLPSVGCCRHPAQ